MNLQAKGVESMNLFGVLDVSGSALKAERVRAEVVAANMANAETTRTTTGGPYRRQQVVFQQANAGGEQSFAASLLGQGGIGVGNMSGLHQVGTLGGGLGQGLGQGPGQGLSIANMGGLHQVGALGSGPRGCWRR